MDTNLELWHRSKQPSAAGLIAVALASLLGLGACDDDDKSASNPETDEDKDAAVGGDAAAPAKSKRFLLSSLVFGVGEDESSSYVSLLDKLDGQEVDYADSREFAGNADTWLFNDSVYIANAEQKKITRYTLASPSPSQGDDLVEKESVDLSDYGVTALGFWLNTFVSPTKAYLVNGSAEYIVWNPTTMEIEKTIDLPKLEADDGFKAQPGYTDRAVLRRGKYLLHPFYYSDADYFNYQPSSTILVVDTEKDEIVETLDAPCPGLDFATEDDDGNFYFSSWIFAPGGAAVLDSPATCVAKIPSGSDFKVETAFKVSDIVDGREGGAFRYLGDGKALLSVLHDDYAKEQGKTVVDDIAYGAYWHFWSYDLKTKMATEIESVDWNAGAAYAAEVDGKPYMLVPAGDYSETQVYELSPTAEPKLVLSAAGWALRLFGVE